MSRLKDDIISLTRAERVKLATAAGVNRDDLIDFAELGLSLTDEQIATLTAWHAIHELRSMFNRPRMEGLVASLSDATGITLFEANAFAASETDLDEAKRKAIRDHFIGNHHGPYCPTLTAMTAQPTNGGLPDTIARRGAALRELNKLSTAELEAIATSLKGRRAA
ncbi:hypothetical protein ACWIEX_19885 [Bosea sp. NPDC055353]